MASDAAECEADEVSAGVVVMMLFSSSHVFRAMVADGRGSIVLVLGRERNFSRELKPSHQSPLSPAQLGPQRFITFI